MLQNEGYVFHLQLSVVGLEQLCLPSPRENFELILEGISQPFSLGNPTNLSDYLGLPYEGFYAEIFQPLGACHEPNVGRRILSQNWYLSCGEGSMMLERLGPFLVGSHEVFVGVE